MEALAGKLPVAPLSEWNPIARSAFRFIMQPQSPSLISAFEKEKNNIQ